MRRLDLRLKACLIGFFFVLAFGMESQAGLKVYYMRHGEVGTNVKDKWKDVPKDQWPAYVGNPDAFTPEGLEQVAAVPAKLAPYHFDFIACSPIWRPRNTVLPYLKEKNLKAEIWPELQEFGVKHAPDSLPPPGADLFGGGKEIVLPDNEKDFFYFREGDTHLVKFGTSDLQLVADTEAMTARVIDMIKKRFGGKDQSILLVGHGNSGRLLLKMLTQNKELYANGADGPDLHNTGIWMAEEQPDGTFKLMMLNEKPYVAKVQERLK